MVRLPPAFTAESPGSIPVWGTKIPQAELHAPHYKKRVDAMDTLIYRESPPKAVLPFLQEGSSLDPTGQRAGLVERHLKLSVSAPI